MLHQGGVGHATVWICDELKKVLPSEELPLQRFPFPAFKTLQMEHGKGKGGKGGKDGLTLLQKKERRQAVRLQGALQGSERAGMASAAI